MSMSNTRFRSCARSLPRTRSGVIDAKPFELLVFILRSLHEP